MLRHNIGQRRNAYFALSAISLICGTAIYPLFRDSQLLVWTVLPKPGFWDIGKIPYEKGGFLSVLADNGPDCLWLLSGIFVLRGMWFFKQKTQAVYVTLFYFIATGIEAGQYFGLIPGTFDFFDLFTMSGVALAEGIIFYLFIKRRIHDEKDNCTCSSYCSARRFCGTWIGKHGEFSK